MVEADAGLGLNAHADLLESFEHLLGVDYPKVRDVAPRFARQPREKVSGIEEQTLDCIRTESVRLAEARAPAVDRERDYGMEEARQAVEEAALVLKVS